ncbi:PREDICTED: uncharacterized protein LOC104604472 [Nelumbo nucifera]|uniref:Uncharacterized protein LOC104604472 n=2 Tax=Nelumbo nucifera TaxID=4432 RepID=A0A1U8AV66_NELNU|nr:PREDICTED: uncharacterized protein LOC104604472 [Nelumbo nucifera]DAD48884.1 TPA_asm: hypothetical protein HUJ06_018821 [Nelumbo nucifera]
MDVLIPNNNFSSSIPVKPYTIPKITDLQQKICYSNDGGEMDENDRSFHHMDSTPQIPNTLAAKDFKSPTIFPTSKVPLPRKKILVERSDASGPFSSNSHAPQTPHAVADAISADSGSETRRSYSSQVTNLSSSVNETDEDEQKTSIPESSSQPYDPFTNSLSPRPKFLRYNPNRRLEIFLRRENQLAKAKDELGGNRCASLETQKPIEGEVLSDDASASAFSSSSGESSMKQEHGSSPCTTNLEPKPPEDVENNGREDGDDDFEEVEEGDRHWHFKEVLKSLLLFGVLILSTLYISSMNSPTPPPYVRALQDLREGYQKIQSHLIRASVENFRWGSSFIHQKQGNAALDITEANDITSYECNEKEEMVKQDMEIMSEVAGKKDEVLNQQGTEIGHISVNELGEQVGEDMEVMRDVDGKQDEVLSQQGTETGQISVHDLGEVGEDMEILWNVDGKKDEVLSQQGTETRHISVHELEEAGEYSDRTDEVLDGVDQLNSAFVISSTSEEDRSLDSENPNADLASEIEPPKYEVVAEVVERDTDQGTGEETVVYPAMEEVGNVPSGTGEPVSLQGREPVENTASDISSVPAKEENSPHKKKVALGFSVILVSTLLGFLHLKRRKTSAEDTRLMVQPSSELMVIDNHKSPPPQTEDHVLKADSGVYLSSSVHSEDRVLREINRSQAPSVKFLGEFVVGEVGSSIKSCDLKSQRIEGEESYVSVSQEKKFEKQVISSEQGELSSSIKSCGPKPQKTEGEESNFSVSQEKRSRRQVLSSPKQSRQSLSDFSVTKSPSYGSFTAEEKLVKKEEGRNGEEMMKKVTTPVRRSSRIRNRTVMSP